MSQPPAAIDEAAGYQPFSALVLAGFGLAVLCAAALAVMAGVALATGIPLLLDPVVLGLPLLAFGLCLGGRVQVLRSEGTRAGLALARWGMIISALTGGGYWGWHLGKGLAVEREARAFADGWLAQLRGARPEALESYVAFAGTQAPDRADPRWPLLDPKFVAALRDQPARLAQLRDYIHLRYAFGGEGVAPYPGFLGHELPQLLAAAGPSAAITPRGLRSWTYLGRAAGGYQVELNYQIDTPEGRTNALITVLSSTSAQGRQWQVLLDGTTLEPAQLRQPTPLGETRQALRLDSREFARDWMRKLSSGLREEAFLDTLPPAQRPALRQRLTAARYAGLLAPALADPETMRCLLLPGFAEFAAGRLCSTTALVADPEIAPAVKQYVTDLFRPARRAELFWPSVAHEDWQHSSPWTSDAAAGTATFRQPYTLRMPPSYYCEGGILVATSDPALRTALTTGDAVPLPVAQRPLRWRIAGMDVAFGTIVTGSGEK